MRHQQLLALIGAVLLSGLAATGAQAHHRSGHGGGQIPVSAPSSFSGQADSATANTTDSSTVDYVQLTTAQRTFITSLLRGESEYDDLLSEATRDEIQAQIDTLPPGIQRRLARGRELPPGIAKKVALPASVNDQLSIDDELELLVVGRDLVVVDPVTNLIFDLINNIL